MLAWTVYPGTFIHFQIGFRRLEIAISMVSTVPFSTDIRRMPWSRIPRNSPGLSCQAGEWQCHGTKDVAMALATGGLCILCWVWSDTDRRFSKTVLNSVSFMVISPKNLTKATLCAAEPRQDVVETLHTASGQLDWSTWTMLECTNPWWILCCLVRKVTSGDLYFCNYCNLFILYTILLWAKSLRVKRLCYIPASQRSSWHGWHGLFLRQAAVCRFCHRGAGEGPYTVAESFKKSPLMKLHRQAVSEHHGWGVLVNSLEKVPWHLGTKCSRPNLATSWHILPMDL